MENIIDIEDSIAKIILALLIGAMIGAEREYKSKNAGFRTIILVTLGSTLFTIISGILTHGKDYHVVGNIVVGIGFLGAGAIFKEGNMISGLTTAVTIWISAALGMAVGAGEFVIAIISALVVMIVLLSFSGIQNIIDRKNREVFYTICVQNDAQAKNKVNQLIERANLRARFTNVSGKNNELTFVIQLTGADHKHQTFVDLISSTKDIISFVA